MQLYVIRRRNALGHPRGPPGRRRPLDRGGRQGRLRRPLDPQLRRSPRSNGDARHGLHLRGREPRDDPRARRSRPACRPTRSRRSPTRSSCADPDPGRRCRRRRLRAMAGRSALVGREAERELLGAALERARDGPARSCSCAGEAGVGKTRLAEEVAADAGVARLRGAREQRRRRALRPARRRPALAPARAPRRRSTASARCARIWRCCCPSSASRRRAATGATLFEAVRGALRARSPPAALVAARRPAVVRRGHARAAGRARAEPLDELPLLVVGAYRSDGLPRDHMLRRLRTSCAAAAASTSWRSRRSTRPTTAELLAAAARRTAVAGAGARDPRPHPGPAVLRRGARARAAVERRGCRRARAASSSPATATCRCPTPSATRC